MLENRGVILKRVGVDELKRVQLNILKDVHNFCIENNINYWLDSGTLIGAIRHKGYIPWDDDIDIGMLRDDYNKFLREYNKRDSKYKCYSIENNNKMYYPFAKVLDTSTILYEPDEKGNKLCINIDLFPYDNAPISKEKTIKIYKKRNRLQRFRSLASHNVHAGCFLRKTLIVMISLPFKLFPKGYFDRKIVKNALCAYGQNTRRIGNFTSREEIFSDERIFDSFVDVEFEGNMFKAPIGYDEWLRDFYGDYMVLPPEKERISMHNYKAYIEDGD